MYDVIIIGGGPAGLASAIKLKNTGLKVALIEKGSYPKQEVCGDGLTEDILRQLPKLGRNLETQFINLPASQKISTLEIKHDAAEGVKFNLSGNNSKASRLFTCPRSSFDELLWNEANADNNNIVFFTNEPVKSVEFNPESVTVITASKTLKAALVIGADGFNSAVTRNLPDFRKHFNRATRLYPAVQTYYTGLNNFKDDEIKLFFTKELLPYYLWIFPLADGRYNVGLGMTTKDSAKLKANLKDLLDKLIKEHTDIKKHFNNAERVSPIKGRPLATAVSKRKISGNRFLLAGDAAGAVNYLTGEGVGNALRCGRLAAETALQCFANKRYDAKFMARYDKQFYSYTRNEIFLAKAGAFVFKTQFLIKPILIYLGKKYAVKRVS